jgi:signal transduction histidine kinase
MSSKKIIERFRTLPFILTLLYALVISIACLMGYVVCHFMLSSAVQKNTDQEILNEFPEYSKLLKHENMNTVKTAVKLEVESEGINKMFFRIMSTDGTIMDSSNMSWWGDMPINHTILEKFKTGSAGLALETVPVPGHRDKARVGYGLLKNGVVLQLGIYLKDGKRFMDVFRRTFRTSMISAILLSTMIGWFLVRRTLRGIDEVTRVALDVSNGNIETRVRVETRISEIEKLATAFNQMLDLVDDLLKGMREVTDNIAHDLRTLVARIRGVSEITLTTGESIADYKNMAATTIEECDRLLNMINIMLDITETEAGTGNFQIEKINIAEMVRDACDLFDPVAEEKGIALIPEATQEVNIYGDLSKIQRMLANLLDNALKYTPSGGAVSVLLSVNDDKQIVISVVDTGTGISNKDLPKIFNRLYRCDQSRSQTGSGLGLSLALAIARAHSGNIDVSSQPGKGSAFTVTLPQQNIPHNITKM